MAPAVSQAARRCCRQRNRGTWHRRHGWRCRRRSEWPRCRRRHGWRCRWRNERYRRTRRCTRKRVRRASWLRDDGNAPALALRGGVAHRVLHSKRQRDRRRLDDLRKRSVQRHPQRRRQDAGQLQSGNVVRKPDHQRLRRAEWRRAGTRPLRSRRALPLPGGPRGRLRVGGGCNTVTGKFSVEELARTPATPFTRLSIIFEQHCEGATAASRGVINYQATGVPDPTPAPSRVIPLTGTVFRIVYDGTTNVAYGLDAINRQLARIDMATGTASYVPSFRSRTPDAVDDQRGRPVRREQGQLADHRIQERHPGQGPRHHLAGHGLEPHRGRRSRSTAPRTSCTPWTPREFRGCSRWKAWTAPRPWSRTTPPSSRAWADWRWTASGTDFYYWFQDGWTAGSLNTYVSRRHTADLNRG